MNRLIACAVVFALMGAVAAFADSGNVDNRDRVCVVQDTVNSKPGVKVQQGGKTYYICCNSCKEPLTKEPEKYTKAVDPVSGTKVDKSEAFIFGLDGKAYYFESDATRKTFAENPSKYAKKK